MRKDELIDDRYRILRQIGSGGMATVYLAMDEYLDRQVAIKFLRLNANSDEKSVERFQREAYSISQLNHPNIVNIYDIVDNDKGHYLVMEYVEGMDLKKYIKENQPLSPEECQDILSQILDGIQSAHENYVIHRDLKPQNIMIKPDGTVKIMDFGIAVISTETALTQTNTIIGSVHYLSPEQARGGIATPQSDVYALGIVGYEMMTGHVPFDGESAISIAVQHFQEPLPDITADRSDIPMAMQNVIYKATAKDASHRYTSCQEMREDLRTALSLERQGETRFSPEEDVSMETAVLGEDAIRNEMSHHPEAMAAVSAVGAGVASMASRGSNTVKAQDKKPKKQAKKDKKEDEEPNKWWQHAWVWLLLVLFLLGTGLTTLAINNRRNQVDLPNIQHMTVDEATEALNNLGISVYGNSREYNKEIPKDHVIDTNPSMGTKIKKGDGVNLIISDGKQPSEMPDVTGMSYEEASAQLQEQGYTVNQANEYSDTVAPNIVMAQDVAAGEQAVPEETTVTLTVSLGQQIFTMADLTGYSKAEVQQYADQYQLQLTFNEDYSDSVDEGRAMAQTISAGSEITHGNPLTVTLSKGQEPETSDNSRTRNNGQTSRFTYRITIPFDDSDDASRNEVEIYIDDKNHNYDSPADTLRISRNRNYTLRFETDNGEEARFKVVRDGETIMESRVVPNND